MKTFAVFRFESKDGGLKYFGISHTARESQIRRLLENELAAGKKNQRVLLGLLAGGMENTSVKVLKRFDHREDACQMMNTAEWEREETETTLNTWPWWKVENQFLLLEQQLMRSRVVDRWLESREKREKEETLLRVAVGGKESGP